MHTQTTRRTSRYISGTCCWHLKSLNRVELPDQDRQPLSDAAIQGMPEYGNVSAETETKGRDASVIYHGTLGSAFKTC